MNIGKNIKFYRRKQRLSQRQLAIRIGVSPSHINKLEKNIRIPSIPLLYRIAFALGVCPKALLGCYHVKCDSCIMREHTITVPMQNV
ncbi:MAG: helix-turn-helix transcriptional regulator [Clostridiaceae bacterium]